MNMMRLTFFAFCCCLFTTAWSQTTTGLSAYYTFEGNLEDQMGNTSNTGIEVGTPTYGCGVRGQGLLLDGANDQFRVSANSPAAGEFDTEDFTVSFYFKSVGFDGIQYLFSKRDTGCMSDRQFYVRYTPQANTLNTFLAQDADKDVNLFNLTSVTDCWQHLVVVRDDLRVRLYLNGDEVEDRGGTASRIDLSTEGDLYIGGADCIGGLETPFAGLIDEVRIYNRVLRDEEIAELFFRPDQIITNDTIVFQGSIVDLEVNNDCAVSNFNWIPNDNLSPTDSGMPSIEADDTGVFRYFVQVSDPVSSCIAVDSFRLTVIDPNTLPCQVAMAKAFTPNFDSLNDTYGLSNPFAIQDMVSFEIFDRWGGRVFATADPFAKWDATFQGEAVNPGIFLWRVIYRCDGEEKNDSGTVT
ncbi:MAG: LamG-like jellyroll fold domain-containing protein, partial [Bacteroidota bacterium]